MDTLNIFSAGAAQAVVARLAQQFGLEAGCTVNARYGAVQSMKSCVVAGEAADIIVLTDALIDELIAQGHVVAGSRVDLGSVGTGVAVRANSPVPAVDSLHSLRATLLASDKIICPDPAAATAGKVLLNVLQQLGISDEVMPRLAYCSSGYEAMAQLARGTGPREVGVMQMTEIIASDGITLAGALPDELQRMAIYSVGLAAHAGAPERAKEFIRQLTCGRETLQAAGFGACAKDTSTHREAERLAN